MPKEMPWFRFYSEAVGDKKLRHLARSVKKTPAEVLGIWCIILSLANESPIRGTLMITEDSPATVDDISDLAGCNVSETLQELLRNDMVTVVEGVICVVAWDKRQFASDNSTERVRKHRQARRETLHETLPQRSRNVPVTASEIRDQNTEIRENSLSPSSYRDVEKSPELAAVTRAYEQFFGIIGYTQGEQLKELVDVYDASKVIEAMPLAKGKNVPIAYMRTILQNWKNGNTAQGKPKDKRAPLAENDPNATGVTVTSYEL